jgi:hypothetical protein
LEKSEGRDMLMRALLAAALVLPAPPAAAQFYKNKTLTLLVNYGGGGNADTGRLNSRVPGALQHEVLLCRTGTRDSRSRV